MQLGFVSAILPDLTLEEVMEFASSEGYDCVELMCWPPGGAERRYAGVSHIDVTDLSEERIDEIQELVDETGVEISALGYYPNPLSPNVAEAEAAVDHLRKVLEAASRLELEQVNTFVGRDWTRSIDDNFPRFEETFRPIVRLAEDLGIYLGIENCPMFFGPDEWPGGKNLAMSPAIWRRMFEAIPSDHFGLNYDPSHLVWLQMDPVLPLWEFKDRIFHAHAKDVRVDPRKLNDVGILGHPLEYHSPKLPGLGQVDWGHYFAVLTDIGYEGAVCVEVEDRAYEGSLEMRKAALRQSCNFLRSYIPEPEFEDVIDEDLDDFEGDEE